MQRRQRRSLLTGNHPIISSPNRSISESKPQGPTDADEHDGYTQLQQGAALPEQEDRLLQWLLVKHRDTKYGLEFLNEDDVKSELNKFPRSTLFDDEDIDENEDDDDEEYEMNQNEDDNDKEYEVNKDEVKSRRILKLFI